MKRVIRILIGLFSKRKNVSSFQVSADGGKTWKKVVCAPDSAFAIGDPEPFKPKTTDN